MWNKNVEWKVKVYLKDENELQSWFVAERMKENVKVWENKWKDSKSKKNKWECQF